MFKRREQVCFAFKIANDCTAYQRVARLIDHFLDCYQLMNVGKMHITGAIDRPHAAHADYRLDQIAILQRGAGLELLTAQLAGFVIQVLGNLTRFQLGSSLWLL